MGFSKKLITATFALVLAFALVPRVVFANDNISVTIDGQAIVFADQQPVIVDGRTLVPVGGVFEVIGFVPSWNSAARTATLTSSDYVIVITIDSATFTTNGVAYTLDVPAQIINGRTMLPIRAVLESVGYELNWNSETRTASITSPGSGAVYVRYLSEEFWANYRRAVAYHIEIYNAFPVNSNWHTMFPSYYGGHLVDDNGNLVMNIVESYGRDGVLSSVISETLNSPYVIMRLVSFSYNELKDTMVFLTDFWHTNPDCKIRNASVSFALCIRNNHVEVALYGYSEELKEAFRTYVLDSPMIVFVEGWPSVLR